MQIDKTTIELNKVVDNIFKLTCNNKDIKFWTPKILIPFGIETEYNKKIIKLELLDNNDPEQMYFKNIISKIEKIIKEKLELDDNEFKTVIRTREKYNDIIESKIKMGRNHVLTSVEFKDKDKNYLKTIYDIGKNVNAKVLLEVNGIWDYRTAKEEGSKEGKKENNKVGLIIYVHKIYVYE